MCNIPFLNFFKKPQRPYGTMFKIPMENMDSIINNDTYTREIKIIYLKELQHKLTKVDKNNLFDKYGNARNRENTFYNMDWILLDDTLRYHLKIIETEIKILEQLDIVYTFIDKIVLNTFKLALKILK